MSTYFIATATITDAELLASYEAAVGPTLAGHTPTVSVFTRDAEVIEGDPPGQRVVVMKFASPEAFRAWYDSPAYQDVIGLRLNSTEGFAVLADGLD